MRAAPGRNSRKSPSCFAPSSAEMKLTPVTLPPGRLRLATRPSLTGSPPVTKTIGTVVVAALAARAEGVLPTITATCRRSKVRHQSRQPIRLTSAERYSIATFWPSTKPVSFRPWRNAATRCGDVSRAIALRRNPTTGIAGCCARAASGHAAAAPPSVGQQFSSSDGDCHTPLPREVRRGNDTTPPACSLHVREGGDAAAFRLGPQ